MQHQGFKQIFEIVGWNLVSNSLSSQCILLIWETSFQHPDLQAKLFSLYVEEINTLSGVEPSQIMQTVVEYRKKLRLMLLGPNKLNRRECCAILKRCHHLSVELTLFEGAYVMLTHNNLETIFKSLPKIITAPVWYLQYQTLCQFRRFAQMMRLTIKKDFELVGDFHWVGC